MDSWRVAVERALSPSWFFVGRGSDVEVIHRPSETSAWEIYGGHLLDEWQTRQRGEFEAWDVMAFSEPKIQTRQRTRILSVKFDAQNQKLYVVRYLLVYGWQPAETSPGVIESRLARKEMHELVGTIDMDASGPRARAVTAELPSLLYLALAGTSRLPITSLESPHPVFLLGRLMYLPRPTGSGTPMNDPVELIRSAMASQGPLPQRAKLLETALRAAEHGQISEVAQTVMKTAAETASDTNRIPALLRTMLNDVSLSPYTEFVATFLRFLDELTRPEALGAAAVIDILSYLLRHLARHLTAYDLTTFHNRGANYPDALLLDAALQMYLRLIEEWPGHLTPGDHHNGDAARRKRIRRRALRQACLLRQLYEGLRVPDAPTSPGDNQRILPEPYCRVPEEQIAHPQRRRKQLYAGQPLSSILTATATRLLDQSVEDLRHHAERQELGMALFLDRPLGIFKQPGHVDRTPLLSYEAFSLRVALDRLSRLRASGLITTDGRRDALETELSAAATGGFPARRLTGPRRPGVVCLEDARLAAPDFVFRKTSRRSLAEFVSLCDWNALARVAPDVVRWLHTDESVLLVRTASADEAAGGNALLTAYDRHTEPQFEMSLPAGTRPRYRESRGLEYLEHGLRVTAVCSEAAARDELRDRQGDPAPAPPTTGGPETIVPFSMHGAQRG